MEVALSIPDHAQVKLLTLLVTEISGVRAPHISLDISLLICLLSGGLCRGNIEAVCDATEQTVREAPEG